MILSANVTTANIFMLTAIMGINVQNLQVLVTNKPSDRQNTAVVFHECLRAGENTKIIILSTTMSIVLPRAPFQF